MEANERRRQNIGKNSVLTTGGFIEVHVDTFELEIRVAAIRAGRIDTMLVANYLSEHDFFLKRRSTKPFFGIPRQRGNVVSAGE